MADETPKKPQCWLFKNIEACSERGAELLFDVSESYEIECPGEDLLIHECDTEVVN